MQVPHGTTFLDEGVVVMAEKKVAVEKKDNKLVKYFKGVKSEFKKITWPTLKQITNNTGTVLVAVIVVGVFIFILDWAFGNILQQFI